MGAHREQQRKFGARTVGREGHGLKKGAPLLSLTILGLVGLVEQDEPVKALAAAPCDDLVETRALPALGHQGGVGREQDPALGAVRVAVQGIVLL
jgi:hypothetical protein